VSETDEQAIEQFQEIPGVRASKAKALYDAGYHSMEELRAATVEQLTEVKGISKKLAIEIHGHLHAEQEPGEEPAPEPESAGEAATIPDRDSRFVSDGGDVEFLSPEQVMLEKGIELHRQGKWGQALQMISEVLAKDPFNVRALMVKGDIYLDREKYQNALDTYDEITSHDPELDAAWVGKGEALLALEQKTRALECFRKALAINPKNDKAQERLGEEERLPTFVDGLDELLEGGIPARHVVMVCGRAGSMKSSFAYYMMHKLAEKDGRKSVYMSLEQSRQSLMRHMKKLGLKKEAAKGLVVSDIDDLVIVDMAALRKESDAHVIQNIDWLKSIINQLKSYKESYGCDAVVIDSLSALYSLTTFKNPRSELFFFFECLRDLGITVFLISEMYGEGQTQFGQYGVEEFLVDGIIHLKTEEYANRANLFLGVVKMRETNHPRDYFPLIVDQFGFGIVRD
jgi:KaiC/GvpD/RAD55 family RecA-like ATPase